MTSTRRGIVAGALLVPGALLWLMFGWWGKHLGWQFELLLIAIIVSLIPPARRWIGQMLERLRHPSPRTRMLVGLLIMVLATVYLIGTGVYQKREWIPKFHDEHMYLLQMQMLARGKLWMAPHQLADFFETTHVLVKPVYAAIYFPGTALMELPTVWFGLPFWVMPAILSGAAVGLFYRVVTEILDGLAGLLAALMLLSLTLFRYLSLIVMSHTNMILLGLAVVWAYLHWRRTRRWQWLAVLGALAGWAAITRPIDSVAYVAPVAIALLFDLHRMREIPWRRKLAMLAIPCLAGAPFLALQLVLNVGVTGSITKTPYAMYLEQFSPQPLWGFDEGTVRPKTTLQQKIDYYDLFTLPTLKSHQPSRLLVIWLGQRLPLIAGVTLPSTLLLILLPLGVLGLSRVPRLVMAAPVVGYVALYFVFAYLLPHYATVVAPPMIFIVLLGRHVLEEAWGGPRSWIAPASTLAIIAMTLPSFAEINSEVRDDGYFQPVMLYNYTILPRVVKQPAIVLYRYRSGVNVHEEPVYNIDVAWPDDAPIIRAHDLGPVKNRELVRYYLDRQPHRNLYLFDRGNGQLTNLGTIADVAKQVFTRPATTTTTSTTTTTPATTTTPVP